MEAMPDERDTVWLFDIQPGRTGIVVAVSRQEANRALAKALASPDCSWKGCPAPEGMRVHVLGVAPYAMLVGR